MDHESGFVVNEAAVGVEHRVVSARHELLDARSGRGAFEMLARADSSHLVCALLQLRALRRTSEDHGIIGSIPECDVRWCGVVSAGAELRIDGPKPPTILHPNETAYRDSGVV